MQVAECRGKVGNRRVDGAGTGVYSKGALFADVAGVTCVAFVTADFPISEKECPKFLKEFFGPCGACLEIRAVASAKIRFLVIDEGLCKISAKEILPADCHLISGFTKQSVGGWETIRNTGVVEPLDQALGDQGTEGLCCITGMVKIIQVNGEETDLESNASRMRTPEKMGVLFMHSVAMRTAVILEGIVAVHFMSGGEPSIEVLEKLLMRECCLFLESGKKFMPGD